MEQLNYNILLRWFVGIDLDEKVWGPTVFTKNRDRPHENGAWARPLKRMARRQAEPECYGSALLPRASPNIQLYFR